MCDPGQASGHWLTEQAARSLPGLDGQVGGKGSLLSGKSEARAAWRWVLVTLVLSHEGTAPRSTGEFLDKTSYPFSREVIRGLAVHWHLRPASGHQRLSGDAPAAVLAYPELGPSSPLGAFLTRMPLTPSYCCDILQLKEPPLAC